LPETTWRRLVELQILIRAEPGRDYYFLADQLSRLLSYLFDDSNATSSSISGASNIGNIGAGGGT
jgi:hypothetical protein